MQNMSFCSTKQISLPILQYNIQPTNLTNFTILTWWHGRGKKSDKQAIISILKNGSFATGIHLHTGCANATAEICLTFVNTDDVIPERRLHTKGESLNIRSKNKWTYLGFSYEQPETGKIGIYVH